MWETADKDNRPTRLYIRLSVNIGLISFFKTEESREITLPKVLERIDKEYGQYLCDDKNDSIQCYQTFKSTLQSFIQKGITSPDKMAVDFHYRYEGCVGGIGDGRNKS